MGRLTLVSLAIAVALGAVPAVLSASVQSQVSPAMVRFYDGHTVAGQPAPAWVTRALDASASQSPTTVLNRYDAPQSSPTTVLNHYDTIQAPSQAAPTTVLNHYDTVQTPSQAAPTTVLRSFDGKEAPTVATASASGSSFDWNWVFIGIAGALGIALLAGAARSKPVRRRLAF
jgi:hypothetical protein